MIETVLVTGRQLDFSIAPDSEPDQLQNFQIFPPGSDFEEIRAEIAKMAEELREEFVLVLATEDMFPVLGKLLNNPSVETEKEWLTREASEVVIVAIIEVTSSAFLRWPWSGRAKKIKLPLVERLCSISRKIVGFELDSQVIKEGKTRNLLGEIELEVANANSFYGGDYY